MTVFIVMRQGLMQCRLASTLYVVNDNVGFLIFLPLSSAEIVVVYHCAQFVWCWGNQTQNFMHAR